MGNTAGVLTKNRNFLSVPDEDYTRNESCEI